MSSSITPSIGSSHGSRRARFSCRDCWRRLFSLIAGLCRRIWRRRAEPVVEIPLSELQAIRGESEAQTGDPDCALTQGLGSDDPPNDPQEENVPLSAPPLRSSSRRVPPPSKPPEGSSSRNIHPLLEKKNSKIFWFNFEFIALLVMCLFTIALKLITKSVPSSCILKSDSTLVIGYGLAPIVAFLVWPGILEMLFAYMLSILSLAFLFATTLRCELEKSSAKQIAVLIVSFLLIIVWIVLFAIKIRTLITTTMPPLEQAIESTQQVTVAAGSADPENGESTSDPHEQGGPSTVACSVSSEPPKEDDEKEGCSASDPKA